MRRTRCALLALVAVGLAGCIADAAPAAAALNGPDTPPPKGCNPVLLSAVPKTGAEVCVHRVLVTETSSAAEQAPTVFTVTDHVSSLTVRVPNWWPSGGPTAGMVVTIWVKWDSTKSEFQVHRWLELTHGTGPAPNGPYPDVRLLDATSSQVPEHRMVWVRATAFLLDPQDTGDGDIHVQTFSPCPSGGLTTETTPPTRGYVDHPSSATDTRSNNDADAASRHLEDAPPASVPVIVFGATRYDYGFGWWEIHPIRAWRFLTQAEAAQNAADCAADPKPHPDKGPNNIPFPFGLPPCASDNSEGLQMVPGFGPCAPRCYVARTAIDQPEQLAADGSATACSGKRPIVTRSLEQAAENTPGSTGISATHSPHSAPQRSSGTSSSAGLNSASQLKRLERVYGTRCRSLRRLHGKRSRAYRLCLLAMARLGGGETSSARFACRKESRRTTRRRRVSDFALCVAAGKGLQRNRIRED
jgi:hypothetical protein